MAKNVVFGLERQIDKILTISEKIMLRAVMFGCFILELCRFAKWLWQ